MINISIIKNDDDIETVEFDKYYNEKLTPEILEFLSIYKV